MSRIDKGTVVSVDGNYLICRITEDGDSCETCPMSKACKAGIEVRLKTNTPDKYKAGDMVRIKIHVGKKLLLQSYIFIVPILALAGGVILGSVISEGDTIPVIVGGAFFALSLLIAIFTSKRKERIIYELED